MFKVLYQLLPDNDWETFKGKPVPQKVDANGNLMWERWPLHGKTPRRLRYFPVLANIDQVHSLLHFTDASFNITARSAPKSIHSL